MIQIFWAGIGYDEAIADQWWKEWWRLAQPLLDRFVANQVAVRQGNPVSIPNALSSRYEYQQYSVIGSPVVDVYRTYLTSKPRIGFGILAESQAHAMDQLPMAGQILGIAGLSRLSEVISVWTVIAPDPSHRRLP